MALAVVQTPVIATPAIMDQTAVMIVVWKTIVMVMELVSAKTPVLVAPVGRGTPVHRTITRIGAQVTELITEVRALATPVGWKQIIYPVIVPDTTTHTGATAVELMMEIRVLAIQATQVAVANIVMPQPATAMELLNLMDRVRVIKMAHMDIGQVVHVQHVHRAGLEAAVPKKIFHLLPAISI